MLSNGCESLRRASLKFVDPTLQTRPKWERQHARHGFRLGPYLVERAKLREHVNVSGKQADFIGRAGWGYELEQEVRGPTRTYRSRCVAQRIPSVLVDYGEVADVANDEIDIACRIDGEHTWRFTARGRLDKNIGGELQRTDGADAPRLAIEILLWSVRLNLVRRHLAAPVMQARHGRQAVAALVAARPEWAWVQAPDELGSIALTTLLAIDALPLGFDES